MRRHDARRDQGGLFSLRTSRTPQGIALPIKLTCTGCGESFLLEDDVAGRKVRCAWCQSIQIAPTVGAEELDGQCQSDQGGTLFHPAFNHDRFLLRQQVMAISEKYVVWDDQERPILFVERPAHFWRNVLGALVTAIVFLVTFVAALGVGLALSERIQPRWAGFAILAVLVALSFLLTIVMAINLSPKRHISFYEDETKTQLLLQVLQDAKFQPIVATYTVLTPEGDVLGRMRKNYLYNVFRKKWEVLDASDNRVLIAREDSLWLSLLRRWLGPMLGFLRANFILVVPESDNTETIRGEFNRNFTLFDRYVLDMRRDRPRLIDRRLAVALGVLLDTGENR